MGMRVIFLGVVGTGLLGWRHYSGQWVNCKVQMQKDVWRSLPVSSSGGAGQSFRLEKLFLLA